MIKYENIRNFVRRTIRFGGYIPVSNLVLTYGQSVLPSRFLRKITLVRNRKIQRFLYPVIDRVCRYSVGFSGREPQKDAPIWFCWFQGEEQMPEIPRLCLASIRRNAGGHRVIVLDRENYVQYCTLPDIVVKRYFAGELKQAHFADILRINLLAQQGGLWLDATMLITAPLPDYVFDMPFFSIKTQPEGYFVSACRWAVFCLAANEGNPLFVRLSKAFEEYLLQTDIFVDYFMFDQFIEMLSERDPEIKKMISEVPFNNPDVHRLNGLLCEEFDAAKFDELCGRTWAFKLNLRTYSSTRLNENPNNFYNRIKSIYLK